MCDATKCLTAQDDVNKRKGRDWTPDRLDNNCQQHQEQANSENLCPPP